MARPIKLATQRTTKSYVRDIEALNRLRTAIVLDSKLDRALADAAVRDIDRAVKSICALMLPSGEHKLDLPPK